MGCGPEVNVQSSILPLTDIVTGTQNTSRFKYVYFIVQLKVHFICMQFLLNTGQWKLLPRKYIFRAHRQPSNFDHLAMLHTVTIVPLSHIEALVFWSIIVWLIHRPIGVDNSLPRVWTEVSSVLPAMCYCPSQYLSAIPNQTWIAQRQFISAWISLFSSALSISTKRAGYISIGS